MPPALRPSLAGIDTDPAEADDGALLRLGILGVTARLCASLTDIRLALDTILDGVHAVSAGRLAHVAAELGRDGLLIEVDHGAGVGRVFVAGARGLAALNTALHYPLAVPFAQEQAMALLKRAFQGAEATAERRVAFDVGLPSVANDECGGACRHCDDTAHSVVSALSLSRPGQHVRPTRHVLFSDGVTDV